LLDYTVVPPAEDLSEAGFVLLPGNRSLRVSALGRFQPLAVAVPTALSGHAMRIVDAKTKATVCSCTTSPATAADLLGFVNCDIPATATLLAGHIYYVLSKEASGRGYFAVVEPGWSISSGYKSLLAYDRSAGTVAGGVSRSTAGKWVESLQTDTMTVAVNLHAVAI
jgi:hypothetical protein